VIAFVAEELIDASEVAKKRGKAVMELNQCEIELGVEIETEGSGKVGIWVVELGGGRTKTESNTISVTFKPLPGEKMHFE